MKLFSKYLPRVNTNVRIIHANPTSSNVDIYANGSLLTSNISFGKISNYITLTPGEYEFQIYLTGTYDKPILTQTLELIANTNYTISFVTLSNNLFLFKLKDDNVPIQKTKAFLRFINLSNNSPLLSLSLPNNSILFNSVEYLETTSYYPLSSGIYNFKVLVGTSQLTAKYIKNITLDSGKFYTIYIIGVFACKPIMGYLFVDDLI